MPTGRDSYHHGDLARALIDATAELVAERGASGFSLREVARQAGVSASAPSHHFGDARGLLTAVAVQGFTYLGEEMGAAATTATPEDRLRSVGRAYVETGLRHPGHVAFMFRDDLVDIRDEDYRRASSVPYRIVESAVAELVGPGVDRADVDAAARTVWATLNGFVNLSSSDAPDLASDPELGALVDAAMDIVTAGVRHRIEVPGGGGVDDS